VRVATVAAVALICWSQTAPLNAIEFVALRFSCNYVGNEVELVPATADRLHVVIGDREQKITTACGPGSADKCRSWTVHRFDLLCGERKVSWRMIADQLLNFTPVPSGLGTASVRAPSEPWELRALRAESGFAPVDELGGHIFSFADKPTPEPPSSRRASDVNTVIASNIANRASLSPKIEPDPALPEGERPTGADAAKSVPSQGGPPQSALISQQLGVPPATIRPDAFEGTGLASELPRRPADGVATRLPDAAKFNLPKRELDSVAAANLTNVQIAAGDNPFIANFATQRWDGEQIGRFLVVLAVTLLLTFMLLTVVHTAFLKRKLVFGRRGAAGEELRSAPEAEACHELMKQIASELMRATGAVNSLQEVPALQSALYRELNSIRQSLGLAPQAQGSSAEKKDWYGIKLQLSTSLQGTQRITEIAEAARASFSSHPAALQDVTTRGEAYAFLGLNATSSEMVLRKTVNALRLCWHPDLATDDEDRRLRETRIKQINMAWDLISRKRMSTC
jgi:hypothetical protein